MGEGGGDLGDYFTASGRERGNITGKGRFFVKGVILVIRGRARGGGGHSLWS
jgi:hypothetical protein